MDRGQAYHAFWSGFLTAYDETSVPADAQMPYITYESVEDDFGRSIAATASVWYRSTSWVDAVAKVKEIEAEITRGGKMVRYDGGAFWIRKADPWSRRLADENDDSVRRIFMNIEVEFID